MKTICAIAAVFGVCGTAWADDSQTSEQRFKNIQVLKGIPGEELIPAMDFISGALGVQCTFCHGPGRFPEGYEKDDLRTKQIARQMMKMTKQINETSFSGRNVVTCASCHNGHTQPQSSTPLATEETIRERRVAQAAATALPPADELFGKFEAAVGGDAAISKLTSRHLVASVTNAAGQTSKTEAFYKAPDLVLQESGGRKFGYDGKQAWASVPTLHALTGADADSIQILGLFYRNLRPQSVYNEARTLRKDRIGDKDAYVVRAALNGGRYTDILWFDAASGLLLRRTTLARSVLGESALSDDFENYREVNGVKVAMDTIRSNPSVAPQKIHYDEVQFNVPIEDGKFAMPVK